MVGADPTEPGQSDPERASDGDDPVHLRCEAVVVERGGRRALDGVDVEFLRGAVTAVVGRSGSGKSTLLRCLNRLEEPVSGRVLLDGQDIRRVDPLELRRRVGMVFQAPVLFPGDVRSNVGYALEQPTEDELAAALSRAGLAASMLDRPSDQLSGGEAQRVTIARALIRRPEALLLDEPTSALDRDATAGVERLVCDLADRGLTIVIVTHDLAQAARLARRVVLLRAGRIEAIGRPDEIEAAWGSAT